MSRSVTVPVLRSFMKKSGLTAKDVAKKLKLSDQAVFNWFYRKSIPPKWQTRLQGIVR